nr:MAG TPA: hypothetical protein [Caudoviricetes sp.]
MLVKKRPVFIKAQPANKKHKKHQTLFLLDLYE